MSLDDLRPAKSGPPPVSALAGFARRSAAAAIDAAILVALLFVESYVLIAIAGLRVSQDLGAGDAPYFAIAAAIGWAYFAGFESSRSGATPGKRAMGVRVVDDAGENLSFALASLRYVARFITLSTLMLGWFTISFTKRRQSLHDLAAGTVVVLNSGRLDSDGRPA